MLRGQGGGRKEGRKDALRFCMVVRSPGGALVLCYRMSVSDSGTSVKVRVLMGNPQHTPEHEKSEYTLHIEGSRA